MAGEGDDLELLGVGDPRSLAGRRSSAHRSERPRMPLLAEPLWSRLGVPIAAGVVTASLLHPQRQWAYLEVAEGHRRAGLELEL